MSLLHLSALFSVGPLRPDRVIAFDDKACFPGKEFRPVLHTSRVPGWMQDERELWNEVGQHSLLLLTAMEPSGHVCPALLLKQDRLRQVCQLPRQGREIDLSHRHDANVAAVDLRAKQVETPDRASNTSVGARCQCKVKREVPWKGNVPLTSQELVSQLRVDITHVRVEREAA